MFNTRHAIIASLFLIVTVPCAYFAWHQINYTPAELIISGIEEPLISIGKSSSKETTSLKQAVDAYMKNPNVIENQSLNQFIEQYPDSSWRVAIQTNLGLMYYQNGAFSLAIEAWEDAWKRGAKATDTKAKAMVDRAYGELLKMHARLGHADRLAQLLEEGKNRAITGQATEAISGAKEGLWAMRNNPGVAYLCGPMALKSLLGSKDPNHKGIELLNRARSGTDGINLNEVNTLAQKVGLDYTMAFRESESTSLPLPVVIHWKLNHYAAVISEKNGLYQIKDPTFGNDLWISKTVLNQESDGYFIIPSSEIGKGWRKVDLAEAEKVYGMGSTGDVNKSALQCGDVKMNGDSCSSAASQAAGTTMAGDLPSIGMPTYDAHSMLVSLNIIDTPVGYTPPVGPAIYTTLTYNQRDAEQPANFSFFNVGPKWTLNWLTYIEDNPVSPGMSVKHYSSGGGAYIYDYANYNATTGKFAPEPQGNAVLQFVSMVNGYKRYLADGSVETYGLSDNSVTYPRRFFLTKYADRQGNEIVLSYDASYRLTSVRDAIGQDTIFSYENTTFPLAITKITDPFGRTAVLNYTPSGKLNRITDAKQMTSAFFYTLGTDFINTMRTPYGDTTFDSTETNAVTRSLTFTDPKGQTERLESRHLPAFSILPETYPSEMTITQNANDNLSNRNSIHWDKRFYQFYGDNFRRADIIHWLHADVLRTSGVIESIKRPSESRVWYNYPDQSLGSGFIGSQENPSVVGRVLDDGTSQVTKLERNSLGKITKKVEPLGKETVYGYAPNQIDLLTVDQKNANGAYERIATYTYDASSKRLPKTFTDGLGNQTVYSYNAQGQLQTATNAKDQTTTYNYTNNYLTSVVDANDVTVNTYTYDSVGRIRTSTNAKGYTLTYDYDELNRLTRITYPDSTYHEYIYDKLDVVTERDQLGNYKTLTHDAVRNLTKTIISDALGAQAYEINYDYYENQTLKTVSYANGNAVNISIDLESRRSKVQDGPTYTLYNYESATSRLKQTTDAVGGVTQYEYDKADRVTKVTDPRNVTTVYTYDILGNEKSELSADRGFIVFNEYDKNNNLKKLTLPSGQIVNYMYDELNRLKTVEYVGASEDNVAFAYDDVSDGNYGKGRLTGITNQAATLSYKYDELGNVITQTTQLVGRDPAVVRYEYDDSGNNTKIIYPGGRVINYYRDTLKRVASVTMKVSSSAPEQTIASDITYKPFGPLTGLTYGNNEKLIKAYDQNYGISRLITTHPEEDPDTHEVTDVADHDLSYSYTFGNSVSEIVDNLPSAITLGSDYQKHFEYDVLNRISLVSNNQRGTIDYDYDAGGNKTTELNYVQISSPTYGTTSNYDNSNNSRSNHLLKAVDTKYATPYTVYPDTTYTYDANGNITGSSTLYDDGSNTPQLYPVGVKYEYSAANRLRTAYVDWEYKLYGKGRQNPKKICSAQAHKEVATYFYNGKGERVIKMGRGFGSVNIDAPASLNPTVWFIYGLNGELLSENDSVGGSTDYIYLDGQPLAMYQVRDFNAYGGGTNITLKVDNADGTTSQTGTWQSTVGQQSCFYGTDHLVSNGDGQNTFTWTPDLSASNFGEGDYYVLVTWDAQNSRSDSAKYTVHTATNHYTYTIDQRYGAADIDDNVSASKNRWAYLGRVHFSGTGGEYIRLDDSAGKPVSADAVRLIKLAPPSFTQELFYIQNDHLGQPQRLFDQSHIVRWDAAKLFDVWGSPGASSINGSGVVMNLRFPGQYYDQETGLHYNYFRDYDPSTGRYLQSDPIGLKGGLNTYAYVGGNPINWIDFEGLSGGIIPGLDDCLEGHCDTNQNRILPGSGGGGGGIGQVCPVGQSQTDFVKPVGVGKQGGFWKGLQPYRGPIKTNGESGKGRGYYQYDYTHRDVEGYNRRGQHTGSYDSHTGEQTKPPVPGRKIPL